MSKPCMMPQGHPTHCGCEQPLRSGWISVEDRLPPPNTRALVSTADGVSVDLFLTRMFHHESHGFPKVTHWMPLPEGPTK